MVADKLAGVLGELVNCRAIRAFCAVQDCRVNGFTFDGFLSVSHGYVNGKIGGDHEITLSVGGKTVGPFILRRKDAVAAVKDFYDDKGPDLPFLKTIPKWVIDLDTACLDLKLA